MSIFDNFMEGIAFRLADIMDNRGKYILASREFREGKQPKQLKVRTAQGQFDDNLVINFTGLVEDRTVSQMFGDGIKFDFEGDDKVKSQQEEWINGLLDANRSVKLWHNAKQYAGDAGTGYFKIIENGITGEDGVTYPRIVTPDPAFMTMETDPDDYERVRKYTYTYKIMDGKKEIVKRQTTTSLRTAESQNDDWEVVDEISKDGGKNYEETGRATFDYCPIIHWQNLPCPGKPEGKPDITDTDRELQNRINFATSNISKIVRLYAHPLRIGVNCKIESGADTGPDKMVLVTGENARVDQLQPLGDLNAAMEFLKWLKQAYFDITRTIDIDSLEDKLGSLTNFGLKVIYQDNASKINTMRAMMGEAIETLLMRCMRVAGMETLDFDIVWPDFIPVNETEKNNDIRADVQAGLLDKITAITEEGRNPEAINQRLDGEKTQETNMGGIALNNWLNARTQGV